MLADGRRVHFRHGPIDLVIEASGTEPEVGEAYAQAWARFQTILEELVAELPLLRQPVTPGSRLDGAVARRMLAAVAPHGGQFVTPMAAVAGAVADEVLGAMTAGRHLTRAYVNNGGDIALFLSDVATFDVGLVADIGTPEIMARARVDAASPARGIATSGWRGRSLSLGIADAVTVLAGNAAEADAAATLIANAVTIESPAVRRRPARAIDLDSDLGDRPVVVDVGPLTDAGIDHALAAGARAGETIRRHGLIAAAALSLRGRWRLVGDAAARLAA